MTILFVDGFDHYSYHTHQSPWMTQFLYKWDAYDLNNPMGISCRIYNSSPGKKGDGMCLYSYGGEIYKYLEEEPEEIVCGFAFKCTSGTSDITLRLNAATPGSNQCWVFFNAGDGSISFGRGSTTLQVTAASQFTTGIWYHTEIKIKIHDTLGYCILNLNDTELINVSGDTKAQSFVGCGNFGFILSFTGEGACSLDDFWIAEVDGLGVTDFLGETGIYTLWPDAAGHYTQLTPYPSSPNHDCVDDLTSIDGNETFNQTKTVGDIDTYNFDSLSVGGQIFCVTSNSCIRKIDAAAAYFKQISRVDSIDFLSADIALSTTWRVHQHHFEENPVTEIDWTESDVNDYQSGVKKVVAS